MKLYNAEKIRQLNPCESGIINFETKYPNYQGTIKDILSLEDIPYSDKVWLATKTVELKTLQMWSVKCAELALPNYEKVYPNDTKIRDCLEVVKKVIRGELESSAAWSAESSAAWSAAWSAESAAWSVAWSAESAAEEQQKILNIKLLIETINEMGEV